MATSARNHCFTGPGRFVALLALAFFAVTADVLGETVKLLGSDFRSGRCQQSEPFALLLHGGTARRPNDYKIGAAFMKRLLREAAPVLKAGASSLDMVHAAIRAMENSGLFNAGRGARANRAGVVEMDASIMEGKRQFAGAVASVKSVKNPISAALMVMQRSRQVLRVGPDAEAFVAANRGAIVKPGYFRLSGLNFDDIPWLKDIAVKRPDPALNPKLVKFAGIWGGVFNGALTVLVVVEKITADGAEVVFGHGINPGWNIHQGRSVRRTATWANGSLQLTVNKPWEGQIHMRLGADGGLDLVYNGYGRGRLATRLKHFRKLPKPENHGTVGAVALDRCGNLAAGTSTGGFGSKVPGRVGDSPIIGAGTYADNKTAAISATGHGEFFMRYVIAYDIAARMAYGGFSLQEAARQSIHGKLSPAGGRGGIIAVDQKGNIAMVYNTDGMLRGLVSNTKSPMVKVY